MEKGIKTCWEFWKCPDEFKAKCPAYRAKAGARCWEIAGNFCPKLKTKEFSRCWECPWFLGVNQEI